MWDKVIALLPKASLIDECWLAYKPWLRDESHKFKAYVRWFTGPKPKDSIFRPYTWRESFGHTPEEALENLAQKLENSNG